MNKKLRAIMKEEQPKAAKARDTRAVLRRMLGYLMQHKAMLFFCFSIMIASNLLALVAPKLSQEAIEAIGTSAADVNMDGVLLYTGLMLACYTVSASLSFLLSVMMVRLSQKIVYTMRRQLFGHLTELPVGYFDTHQTGEIISRISYDIDTVNASLSHDLLQVCASAITVIGAFVMMAITSPALLGIFVVTVPISIGYTRFRSKKVRPLFRRRSKKLGELNGYAEEMLSGQKTVRAYHREEYILDGFRTKNEDAVDAYYAAEYFSAGMGPTVNFINNLSLSLVAMVGGIFYMNYVTNAAGLSAVPVIFTISLGGIAAFVQYSRKFAGPVNEFANILAELQSACAAAEKVFAVMDEKPEEPDAPGAVELTDVEGNVTLSHVHFGYTEDRVILPDLSFSVKKGQTIAIVGPTGAGKTTIINLLMRFYDVGSGEILLDGHPVREITRSSLRKAYTMVLQDTWLFSGTVYDNIVYGREEATREQVEDVIRRAHLAGFVASLPQGMDTVLSDDGVNISKGHKQLLTIARAMLCDAPILILDEATSNVDSRTEQIIQHAMSDLMVGRTSFVIAHRLSTIEHADLILVMQNGNVIEQGTHEELMSSGGFYCKLYRSQFDS